jgi:hypothetical protein
MPNKGKRISGRNDVTGIGTASLTHQVIIQAAIASTLLALGEIKADGNIDQHSTNRSGPRKNPI